MSQKNTLILVGCAVVVGILIGGLIVYQSKVKQFTSVPQSNIGYQQGRFQPTNVPTQTLTTQESKISNISDETYEIEGSGFGYQYKYPSNWQLFPERDIAGSMVQAPGTNYDDRQLFWVERSLGGASYCEDQKKAAESWKWQKVEKVPIMIDSIQTVAFIGRIDAGDQKYFDRKLLYVSAGDYCYQLDAHGYLQHKDVFDKIFSSFRFLKR